MSVNNSDSDEVCTCRNCRGTTPRTSPGTYPVGWYGLTVSVPEWYREDGSDKQYIWVGMFCSPACLVAHGPKLQADADLARQVYDSVIPTPHVGNPQGMRSPRP